MIKLIFRFLLPTLLLFLFTHTTSAGQVVVEIITEIRPISVLTFQEGEKSRQRLTFDFDSQSVSGDVETGHTTIAGFDLQSVRNAFTVTGQSFSNGEGAATAKGQTASYVRVMPDIDYEFTVRVNESERKIWVSGCHNEYPSYRILVNGTQVYDREQTGGALLGLLGTCDIRVSNEGTSF
jgi:hypothetical protein